MTPRVKVSDTGICPTCKSKKIIKNGFTKNRKQQYYCKSCNTRSIDFYSNMAFCKNINSSIIKGCVIDLFEWLVTLRSGEHRRATLQ